MRAKLKHPVLWAVIWNDDGDVVHVSLKKPSRKWKDSNGEKVSVLRYHLHPGNEVKLKRENEWMRRWLRDLLTGKAGHFEMMAVIKPRMPDLFAGGKKGK